MQPSSNVRAIGREKIAPLFSIEWRTINLEADWGVSKFFRKVKYAPAILRIFLVPINLIRNWSNLSDADVLYVIKFPPIWFSRVVKYFCKIVIYDFDDPMWLKQFVGTKKFTKHLMCYDAFTCDNELQLHKGKVINPVGKVIEGFVPNFVGHVSTKRSGVRLIWVGSRSTQMYLKSIQGPLTEVLNERDFVSLRLLGVDRSNVLVDHKRVSYLETYNETEMQIELCEADIGLFPLLNDELSSARGVHKANIYFAAGIPVVATSSLLIQHRIEPALTGHICHTIDDWSKNLLSLIDNEVVLLEMKRRIQFEFQVDKRNHESTQELFQFFRDLVKLSK
jgi:hypothetical protein